MIHVNPGLVSNISILYLLDSLPRVVLRMVVGPIFFFVLEKIIFLALLRKIEKWKFQIESGFKNRFSV